MLNIKKSVNEKNSIDFRVRKLRSELNLLGSVLNLFIL